MQEVPITKVEYNQILSVSAEEESEQSVSDVLKFGTSSNIVETPNKIDRSGQVNQFKNALNFVSKNTASFKMTSNPEKTDTLFHETVKYIINDIGPSLVSKLDRVMKIKPKIKLTNYYNIHVLRLQLECLFSSTINFYKNKIFSLNGYKIENFHDKNLNKNTESDASIKQAIIPHNGPKTNIIGIDLTMLNDSSSHNSIAVYSDG